MSRPLLLCTDLDRTLIPNGEAPESPRARPLFRALVQLPEVALAYVSGRHQALVRAAIADWGLPVPDHVIGDVGASLYRVGPDGWTPSAHWQAAIGQDWGHNGPADFIGWFADLPGLRLQEPDKQAPLKLSYYTPADLDPEALRAALRERLAVRGIAASLIWSLDEVAGVGLLDVLPPRATKYHAVDFLRRELGLAEDEVLFAGDSGNDLEVLASPLPAVLVANASAEVRTAALCQSAEQGLAGRLYCAGGGLYGMNGNYAAGILEGVAHFRPEVVTLLPDLGIS